MTNKKQLQIGDVARAAGVNVQTIRYYERRKILAPAERKDSGYRLYTEDAVTTIRFVKHAQELGFKLDEIRDLLALRIPSTSRCKRVRERSIAKLSDVQGKIKMLKKIERTILKLIKDCEADVTSKECPIIRALE